MNTRLHKERKKKTSNRGNTCVSLQWCPINAAKHELKEHHSSFFESDVSFEFFILLDTMFLEIFKFINKPIQAF